MAALLPRPYYIVATTVIWSELVSALLHVRPFVLIIDLIAWQIVGLMDIIRIVLRRLAFSTLRRVISQWKQITV